VAPPCDGFVTSPTEGKLAVNDISITTSRHLTGRGHPSTPSLLPAGEKPVQNLGADKGWNLPNLQRQTYV